MQQVVNFRERFLATVAELQPVGLVEFAKVAQRVDAASLTDVRSADAQVAILNLDVENWIVFS